MTTYVHGVILRRSNVVTLTANVGNVGTQYVTGLASATSNVVLADAAGKLVLSNVAQTTFSYLNGVTSPIQAQLDSKLSVVGGSLIANNVIISNNLILSGQTAGTALVINASGNVVSSNISLTELEALNGITGNVQQQLDGKQSLIVGAASTVVTANLNPAIVVVSDANGKITNSSTTVTELGFLNNVTSDIQAQLDGKANVGGAASFQTLTVTGNLVVLGNTTQIMTEQLIVEDPVLVLNSERLAQPTGLYLQQTNNANVALLYQNGNLEFFSTGTQPNATSYGVASYLPVHVGNAYIDGTVTVVPRATSNGYMSTAASAFTAVSSSHTIPASAIDGTSGAFGIFAGQLMVFVTNYKRDATNKTGYAAVSLLKTPPDFDVVPISVHKNINLDTFDIGKSTTGNNIVVLTDADCSVSWKFDGSTIR